MRSYAGSVVRVTSDRSERERCARASASAGVGGIGGGISGGIDGGIDGGMGGGAGSGRREVLDCGEVMAAEGGASYTGDGGLRKGWRRKGAADS